MVPAKRGDELPEDVASIRVEIAKFLDRLDDRGIKIGNSQFGVYTFFDYDAEPIYVGQTCEKLRSRIGRHLTNQRTDAVAMNVLDPFEVAEIEVWPLDAIIGNGHSKQESQELLNKAEYSVFNKVIAASAFGVVLNEKNILPAGLIDLPQSYRGRIIPEPIYSKRKHPDIRIARRATTIAQLARVISERSVSSGLRRTLLTQARRLEKLAKERLDELNIDETNINLDESE